MSSQPTISYSLFFDFHTLTAIPEVGANFDAEVFAEQLRFCGVDFLTFHARCNQGHAYYPTKIGKPHPGLKTDIVGALVKACHDRGIRISVYFNAHLSDEELLEHPEWLEQPPTPRDCRKEGPFYRRACYNSTFKEHLLAMAKEVLEWYDVDGFFFDCLGVSDCVCPACQAKMSAQGFDSTNPEDLRRFSTESCYEMCRWLHDELVACKPSLRFFFNGRPFERMIGQDTQWEAECLPTASWGNGYDQLPLMAHYLRTLGGGDCQVLNMTCRFNDWGDFGSLRPLESLEYDMFYGIANGMRPDLGDHLPPDGIWPRPVFEHIRELYEELRWYDRWSLFAENRPEVALVYPRKTEFDYYPAQPHLKAAVRILTELKVQFDLVTTASSWEKYRVLIFPDDVVFTPEVTQRVQTHLRKGGKILATGMSGLEESGERFALGDQWPAIYRGKLPYTPIYYLPQGKLGEGLPEMPLSFYAEGANVTASPDATVEISCVRPLCSKGWDGLRTNFYTPPESKPSEPFVLRKGNIIYLSGQLFDGYSKAALREDRLLIANILRELDPTPLLKTEKMPSYSRAFVQFKEDLRMIHLLTYCPERRQGSIAVEDRPVMLDARISLRTDGRPVQRVILAARPDVQELPFQVDGDYCSVTVPRVEGYALLVFS